MAVTQAEYLAQIAREEEANIRARAEGYESAAHKEAHANVKPGVAGIVGGAAEKERQANIRAAQVTDPRTGAPFGSASDMESYANSLSAQVFNPATGANFTSAADYEIDANRRAQAAGFANAAEQEMDANRRSIAAGFTSAVDQEIDANRRAREAGYLNAADLETYGAAGATRSTDPFLDPRLQPAPVIPEQFRLGTANLLKYNPDQPNVPGYDPNWRNDPKYASRYGTIGFDVHGNPITGGGVTTVGGPPNPTVPSFGYPQYQDWTRFMPTNFQLAEGGGMHYQPGAWGNLPGTVGAAIGAGNNIWNTGTTTGGTTATGGPGPINPNIWGTPNANVNTTGVRPGSDKANDLAAGRTHHPQMYDANDMWIGAEGGGPGEANWTGGGLTGAGAGGVPWQDTFIAPLGNKLGWNAGGTSANAQKNAVAAHNALAGSWVSNPVGMRPAAIAAYGGGDYFTPVNPYAVTPANILQQGSIDPTGSDVETAIETVGAGDWSGGEHR